MSTDDSTSRLPSRDLNDHPPDPHDSTSDDSATATAELANGDEVVSSPYHQHILSSINTSYHSAAGSTVQNNDSQTSLLLSHSPARASTSSPHRRPQSLSFADTPHARTPLLSSPDHRTLPNGSARPGSLYGSLSSPRSLRSRPNAHGENDEDRDSLPRLRTISSARNFGDLLKDRARKTMSIMRADVSSYDQVSTRECEDVDVVGPSSNGRRAFYSSFQSIDWIHDIIKASDRQQTLAARSSRSLRGKWDYAFDRAQGWVAVTLVGVCTAIVAFLIVRSEGFLFDLKEGYCSRTWYLSRGFCCRGVEGDLNEISSHIFSQQTLFWTASTVARVANDEGCSDWKTWESVVGPWVESGSGRWIPLERYIVECLIYILAALFFATLSSYLTVRFTKSTDFESRKDINVTDAEGNEKAAGGAERKVMYFAAGSGIPEIKAILSGYTIHGFLGWRTLVVKSVGLALSVASGLTLGKEGPMVKVASCIGNLVSRAFVKYETNEAQRRQILSAACAAGVSVAFGAPIGGTLFSLEEVSFYFPPKVMWRSFWAAMVAATTLKYLNPFGSGKIVLFEVTYDMDWRFWEVLVFVFIATVMGVWGAVFAKLNIAWSKRVRGGTWLKQHPIAEVALVTLLTALLSFLNPLTRLGGTELVLSLLSECKSDSPSHLCDSQPSEIVNVILSIGLVMLVKGGLTVITFGIRVPAGVFVPTLAVGACFGRATGLAFELLQHRYPHLAIFEDFTINPGVYAIVGAAASLAGVTRTTVSLAVIVVELTNSLTYVVPISLAILTAKTVADSIEPRGIYDLVIEMNALPFLDAKESHSWGTLQVADVLEEAETIRADKRNTVSDLTEKVLRAISAGGHDASFPVVVKDAGGLRLQGVISVNELEHCLVDMSSQPDLACSFNARPLRPSADVDDQGVFKSTEKQLGPFMDQAPITVQLQTPLELVQQIFVKLGVRYIVVLDAKGFTRGLIDKGRWLTFLQELEASHGH